jgi:transcriptional regulator with XRE-family HTH domain
MKIGERVRLLREKLGITQANLANLVDTDGNTVSRWERNKLGVRAENLSKLSVALNTTVAYLLGETEVSEPILKKDGRLGPAAIQVIHEMVSVPVLDLRTCAGLGSSHIFEESEVLYEVQLPAVWAGPISVYDDKKPFLTKINGDSMSAAGLHDGALALVNPAADVHSGDAAMVCFGEDRETALKWVYFLPRGVIELRSATPGFPVYTYTSDQQLSEEAPMIIIGRVMGEWVEPKKG